MWKQNVVFNQVQIILRLRVHKTTTTTKIIYRFMGVKLRLAIARTPLSQTQGQSAKED